MSSIAQNQLRYFTVENIDALRNYTSAFAGDMSLVLSTKTLYQCVHYAVGGHVPTDNSDTVLAIVDNPLARWVAIDSYTSNSVSGSFTKTGSEWVHDTTANTYYLLLSLINTTNNCICRLYDDKGVEVLPQEIKLVNDSYGIIQVKVSVSDTPDCRFSGSYYIIKDKLV